MISGIVLLYIIALILIASFVVLNYFAIRFLMVARLQKKLAIKYTKHIEERTKKEFNKIATLPPVELHSFFAKTYPSFLTLAAEADVTDGAPNNAETLYTSASAKFLEYLGDETVEAINYYYGKDYVVRWMEHVFRVLVSAGVISDIIENKRTSKDIGKYLI